MKCQDFSCYTKKNNVLSVGMNLNNIIAKHYYSENVMTGGGFRKNLNIPLPLVLLNHENSFLKKNILNNVQMGGKKNKKNNDEIISDSLFDKLIDLKSKTNFKHTRKHKRGGKRKKKTKKLFIF
jgi:hypothetical protein